ncbi:MAG: NAD(P)H-hydrate dehydratase [Bacteroidia bacterium]
MLPIYNAQTLKEWEEFTLKNKSLESIDLMERAALSCVVWITKNISTGNQITIVCGNGNNGGDGLAIARLLLHSNYTLTIYVANNGTKSENNISNLEKIEVYSYAEIKKISENGKIFFEPGTVIIDCIFGTGFNKPVDGFWQNAITSINESDCRIISIDIPSGLVSEPSNDSIALKKDSIIKASLTLTLQTPKLSMLIPGWGNFCGHLEIIDIGLSPEFIAENPTKNYFISYKSIKERFKKREKFSHKGTYGHALVIAGDVGKSGAAILCSKACFKSGAGLVTVFSNFDSSLIINIAIPEVMTFQKDPKTLDLNKFSALGIGPGMGISSDQVSLLKRIFSQSHCPMLLDADAITIIASNPDDFRLPANTILTPHPKEFDRLTGLSANGFERLKKAQKYAKDNKCILVLKGAYTVICSPDGKVYFNSTGNAGMATAGAGDVLSGVITAFLTQGYSPIDSAILGVFIHGEAGDAAAKQKSLTGLIASDIIDNLDSVFKSLESH